MTRRILHIIESLDRTGVTSQALVLSRGLAERGADVHVAALDGRAEMASTFRDAGIDITLLGRRWSADPLAFAKMYRFMRRVRPEVIHTWNYDAGLYGRVAARLCGVRNVVVGQYSISPFGGGKAIDKRLANVASRVTNSPVIGEWWRGEFDEPKGAIAVIPPGVPIARSSTVSREQLLQELGLPAEARLIGVVGRLAPEKRVRDLIWAADLLRVLHDNLRLLVIGDGPLRAELEQYARLASDLDHIRFLGARADVQRIVPHLDALWNASENRRHSVAILEAMAARVPVVAGDTPLNRELVAEDETGYLVPLLERSGRADRARHTDRIFNDRETARRLGEAAERRIEECFNTGQFIQAYVNLYAAAKS